MKSIFALLALAGGTLMAQNPAVTEILNNYGLINAGTVAQGAIFIVKGSALVDVQTETLQSPPRQSLSGVEIRVTVNGVTTTCLMYYAFNFQLAAILPSNTPTGNGTLVVVNNNKVSAPAAITVVSSAFGMLTVNGSGTGLAAVHDPNYVLLSNTNAARPGMNVVFYGSGLGAVINDLVPPLASLTQVSIAVNIGGVNARVLYHGRTIYPGLDQINVEIPTLQAYSCAVAVVITSGGRQANAGTIPVTQSGTTCQQGGGGGGSNSGSEPTQEEVNRWISQGSYTTGTVNTNRANIHTIAQTGATTVRKEDSLSASFFRVSGADLAMSLRGEIPPGYAQFVAQVGSCVVYTGLAPAQYPRLTVTSLDAGASVTASGPNGTLVAPRTVSDQFISYFAEAPANFFASGNYSFTGTGGPGAGAFSGNMNVGAEFVVTNNADDFKTITRGQPLTIRWTGGDAATQVFIFGFSSAFDGMGPGATSYFSCRANNSAGQFTIPAAILGQLPASGRIEVPGFPEFSQIFRGTLSVSTSNRGNRLTIPNIDLGFAAHSWTWAYTPDYR